MKRLHTVLLGQFCPVRVLQSHGPSPVQPAKLGHDISGSQIAMIHAR